MSEVIFSWEVFKEIFIHLDLKDLIKIGQLSHLFSEFIKTNPWPHWVSLQNVEKIKYVVDNYRFMNYDFRYSNITDAELQHLGNLGNCRFLFLGYCDQITDAGIQHLSKCRFLYLTGCDQITDASVRYLGKCHTLILAGCDKITDASVQHLGNCHTLWLTDCVKITDAAAQHLSKCHILILRGCNQNTDGMKQKLRKTVAKLVY